MKEFYIDYEIDDVSYRVAKIKRRYDPVDTDFDDYLPSPFYGNIQNVYRERINYNTMKYIFDNSSCIVILRFERNN